MEPGHLFILNPKAGRTDRTPGLTSRICDLMESRQAVYRIAITEYPEHATALVRKTCADGGLWRVYACGGDGTLNEVAQGARGLSGVTITQYPLGHANSFLRQFGLSHFYDLEALLGGGVYPIDLMDCNGRVALNVCAVGLDAGCSPIWQNLWHTRLGGPGGTYLLAHLRRLCGRTNQIFQITADGVRHTGRYLQILTFNGRYNAGGFRVLPEAHTHDGMLDHLLIGHPSRLRYLVSLPSLLSGRHSEIPDIAAWFRVGQTEITSDIPFAVTVDGECFATDHLNISLSIHKMNFAAPSGPM